MDVTVVVPTYNRASVLATTLAALAQVEHPRDRWETVVVDDGSPDGTGDVVREATARSPVPVRYLRQENRGAAAARNAGANQAAGQLLVFIDDDIEVAPDFISRHLKVHRAHPGSWVVGRVVNIPGLRLTPFGRYRDDLTRESQPAVAGAVTGITAANLSLPAADFRRLGGFDERFAIASCEDWDLAVRARRAGITLLYDPDIVVTHHDWAVDLQRYCERQRLYSVSDVLLFRKYGEDSPRAQLIRANAPWVAGPRTPARAARVVAKAVLATPPARALLTRVSHIADRLAPDSSLSRRLYDAAVAVAIFRGVREGWASEAGARSWPR